MSTSRRKKEDGVDRRTIIKRALAASGAGYVAPLILGTASPAAAQILSGSCAGAECLDDGCGPTSECACVAILGADACVVPFCTNIPCDANADCGPGGVCMTSDCCSEGEPTCVFLCGTEIPAGLTGGTQSVSASRSAWRSAPAR